MNRKKGIVGLCIAYKEGHNNYGTSLVGYAMVRIIEKYGLDFDILVYNKSITFKDLFVKVPLILISGGWKSLLSRIKHKRRLNSIGDFANGERQRTLVVNNYKEKKFGTKLKIFNNKKQLVNHAVNYDLFLVGSDQVWLPAGLYKGFFNLLFAPDSIPKFSYSSSFGVSKIPFWQRRQTRRYLNRLELIGVREISGKNIVENLSDRKAEVVLDPTFLLSPDEWKDEAKQSMLSLDYKYIFCYFLGRQLEPRKAVLELQAKTGLKIVFLPHMDEYVPSDEYFGDFRPYDVDPNGFLKLIMNAEYVCTDSFHCTAFSLLFQRQFITFYRFNSKSSNSRNSRIDSLFELLHLEDRLYDSNIFESMIAPIDFQVVFSRLEELQVKSLEFLSRCLTLKDTRG